MFWKAALFVSLSVLIFFSFTTPAPQKEIGEASRIFYYHIPQAWICVLAFAMSMIFSIRYLRSRSMKEDDKALAAARLGFLACALATLTGSIFAKVTWGSFWNWDPRETSIFILLLIYAAYFALRSAIEEEERKAMLSSVYSIFAFVSVPFFVFIVPRYYDSLHPEPILNIQRDLNMDGKMFTTFLSSLFGFTALFFWIFKRI